MRFTYLHMGVLCGGLSFIDFNDYNCAFSVVNYRLVVSTITTVRSV